ncbi:MAG: exonuclease domain-containing protein [Gammaproteobacteria bacterium]
MPQVDDPLAGAVACVDLETTGGHAVRDRVIEAGVVLLEDGAVVEEWSTLVNPGVRIPYAIQQFTGISEAMVADAPPFAEVAEALAARLQGRLFVAHNARFDYGFLRSEFRRLGRRLRAPVLCTVRLSRALTPAERGHNLDAVMSRWGIACEARHRALGDARVLADFLRLARERCAGPELGAIVRRLLAPPRLPPQLDPAIADELPEGPGVYLIHGEGDALLYVGKAKNLATRVPAHFAGPQARREQELSHLARRIDWIETAGEFGALLTEARLVKERRPLLNRRLRGADEWWTVRLGDDASGARATIEPLAAGEDPGDGYGMFRREADARRALEGLVREHALCAKQLGLERGAGSCVAFQLGRCRGACAGREPAPIHELRVRMALAGLRRRAWPFDGPVAIRERDWRGVEDLFVFDDWRLEGGAWDPDIYRILAGFFERPLPGAELIPLAGRTTRAAGPDP